MTSTLALAIILLVFTFYISSLTLIFPLVFPYLFLLLTSKDLPKSKFKHILTILSCCGMILSLLWPELWMLQEFIVLGCVMICAWMMDQKSYHGILSGLTIVFILPIAQMINFSKGNQISGFVLSIIILCLSLYYFYFQFNLYLTDIEIPKKREKN